MASVISQNNLLYIWPSKPYKIMQFKMLESSPSLWEYPKNFPGHHVYAYLKGHQVSKKLLYNSSMHCSIIMVVPLVGVPKGRWMPRKSADILLCMLKNVESNAELTGLWVDFLVIKHIHVNKTPKWTGCVYRAHGWINTFIIFCHNEMTLTWQQQNKLFLNQDSRLHRRKN